MIAKSQFQDFFRRYRESVGGSNDDDCDSLARFFDRVRPEMARLREAVLQEEKDSAPDFNIFRALRLERKETVLHTPMLAHLLDPSASHGQGVLFLRGFLKVVLRHPCSVPSDESVEGGHWMVLREFYIAGVGIIDLLIENPGKKCIIVIENKIDADDHSGQLRQYQEWVASNRPDYRWRQLIYLTPDGRCPTSDKADSWLCLSHRRNVSQFLEESLGEVKPPSVRAIVQQYIAILKHLTEDNDDQAS